MDTPEVSKRKVKIYVWKYDDGARGYAVRDKSEERSWLERQDYTSKRMVKQCLKKQEAADKEVREKKVEISGGLSSLIFRKQKELKDETDMLAGMQALLNSCGTTPDAQRDILCLVASVLAGYCARKATKHYPHFLSPRQRRAPIITVKQAPYADLVLERIMRSLALDSTQPNALLIWDDPSFQYKYSPILPAKLWDENITDHAWMKLDGSKHRMLPQYRDTALMLYGWILRGKDRRRFQSINRWVSLVLYDFSPSKAITAPIELKGAALSSSSCDWDKGAVRSAVYHYAHYVYSKMTQHPQKWKRMLREQFSRYDALIDSYNQNASVKRTAWERHWISMQLLALHLFLKACKNQDGLNPSDIKELENQWFQTLLPGCTLTDDTDFTEKENLLSSEQIQTMFENAICKILEENVPDKFYFDGQESRAGLLGDIRKAPTKQEDESDLALRITVKQLEKLLDPYSDGKGGKWLYRQAESMVLPYMSPQKKIRIKATGKNESHAVALSLEKMKFLPESLLSQISALAGNTRTASELAR